MDGASVPGGLAVSSQSVPDFLVLFLVIAPLLMFAFGLVAVAWLELTRGSEAAAEPGVEDGPRPGSQPVREAVDQGRIALKRAERRSDAALFFFCRRALVRLLRRRSGN